MSSISIAGDTSGSVILTVPAAAGSGTITLPSGTGTAAVQGLSTNIVSGTTQTTTSGTSIDFTSIPSWVKRITVMWRATQRSGTSAGLVVVGTSSGFVTTGYVSYCSYLSGSTALGSGSATNGFITWAGAAADVLYGQMVINHMGSNVWLSTHTQGFTNAVPQSFSGAGGGSISLSGTLDRVRFTSANGTDTFTAGSVNIFYE